MQSTSRSLLKPDPSIDESLIVVGWQERIALSELGIDRMHAKLDTGAALSSLHALEIEHFRRNGWDWVRFDIVDDCSTGVGSEVITCEAPLMGFRHIRSSNGHVMMRPMIETTMTLGGFHWTVEFTLCDRNELQFRALVGRNALAGRCVVDSGRTHILSR